MKKLFDVIFILFNIVAIFLTTYLLNVNDSKVCRLGTYSFVSLENSVEEANLSSGTLLIGKQENAYQAGDKVFYTKNNSGHRQTTIETIKSSSSRNGKKIYTFEDDRDVEETKINGLVGNEIAIAHVGSFINYFEKENIYIVTIVVPLFGLFIYQFVFQGGEAKQKNKEKTKKQKRPKQKANIIKQEPVVKKQKKQVVENKKNIDENLQIINKNRTPEIIEKEKMARQRFENLSSDEDEFNKLKEIEKQYINLIKYGNGINDIDINEYYNIK